MDYNNKVQYIQLYLCGELNSTEVDEFNTWLTSNSENKILFNQLKSIWDNASPVVSNTVYNYQNALAKHKNRIQNEQSFENEIVKPRPTNIFRLRSVRLLVAAIIVFVFGFMFLFKWSNTTDFTSENEKMAITLEDGTNVLLGPHSQITFRKNRDTRELYLKGIAYFEVFEDKSKPFIITTDNLDVKVLGTKFTVDASNKVIKVKEGKVEVGYGNDSQILTKNQQVFVKDNRLSNVEDSKFDDIHPLGNDELLFDNVSFDKVVKDIGYKFGIQFILPGTKDWDKCKFTSGSLKKNTLDEILTILKLTYDLEYSKKNDSTYVLNKVHCK